MGVGGYGGECGWVRVGGCVRIERVGGWVGVRVGG